MGVLCFGAELWQNKVVNFNSSVVGIVSHQARTCWCMKDHTFQINQFFFFFLNFKWKAIINSFWKSLIMKWVILSYLGCYISDLTLLLMSTGGCQDKYLALFIIGALLCVLSCSLRTVMHANWCNCVLLSNALWALFGVAKKGCSKVNSGAKDLFGVNSQLGRKETLQMQGRFLGNSQAFVKVILA